MVRRPLEGVRPFGPVFNSSAEQDESVDISEEDEVEPDVDFNNHPDLVESGSSKDMFISYINSSAELLNMEPEEFAKSVQARNYARKLGVEKDVYTIPE